MYLKKFLEIIRTPFEKEVILIVKLPMPEAFHYSFFFVERVVSLSFDFI